jgi:hypothetical protein
MQAGEDIQLYIWAQDPMSDFAADIMSIGPCTTGHAAGIPQRWDFATAFVGMGFHH